MPEAYDTEVAVHTWSPVTIIVRMCALHYKNQRDTVTYSVERCSLVPHVIFTLPETNITEYIKHAVQVLRVMTHSIAARSLAYVWLVMLLVAPLKHP